MSEGRGYNGVLGKSRIRPAPHWFERRMGSHTAWAMRRADTQATLAVPAPRAIMEAQAKKINRAFNGLIQHDPEQIAAALGTDDVMFMRFDIARMLGWLATMDIDLALRQDPEARARTNTTCRAFLPNDDTGAGPETPA